MHICNYPPFFPDQTDYSKGCMREYLEVCEIKSGRRACQANAKHLTWKKNMGNWNRPSSCILMQLRVHPIPFYIYASFLQRKKNMGMISEITLAMLAVITAKIDNENNDSLFQ